MRYFVCYLEDDAEIIREFKTRETMIEFVTRFKMKGVEILCVWTEVDNEA